MWQKNISVWERVAAVCVYLCFCSLGKSVLPDCCHRRVTANLTSLWNDTKHKLLSRSIASIVIMVGTFQGVVFMSADNCHLSQGCSCQSGSSRSGSPLNKSQGLPADRFEWMPPRRRRWKLTRETRPENPQALTHTEHKHTPSITHCENPAVHFTHHRRHQTGLPSPLLEDLIFREKNRQGLRSEINGAVRKMKA